jgi:hypothetical protein
LRLVQERVLPVALEEMHKKIDRLREKGIELKDEDLEIDLFPFMKSAIAQVESVLFQIDQTLEPLDLQKAAKEKAREVFARMVVEQRLSLNVLESIIPQVQETVNETFTKIFEKQLRTQSAFQALRDQWLLGHLFHLFNAFAQSSISEERYTPLLERLLKGWRGEIKTLAIQLKAIAGFALKGENLSDKRKKTIVQEFLREALQELETSRGDEKSCEVKQKAIANLSRTVSVLDQARLNPRGESVPQGDDGISNKFDLLKKALPLQAAENLISGIERGRKERSRKTGVGREKIGRMNRVALWANDHPQMMIGIVAAVSLAKPIIGFVAQQWGVDFGIHFSPNFNLLSLLTGGAVATFAGTVVKGEQNGEGGDSDPKGDKDTTGFQTNDDQARAKDQGEREKKLAEIFDLLEKGSKIDPRFVLVQSRLRLLLRYDVDLAFSAIDHALQNPENVSEELENYLLRSVWNYVIYRTDYLHWLHGRLIERVGGESEKEVDSLFLILSQSSKEQTPCSIEVLMEEVLNGKITGEKFKDLLEQEGLIELFFSGIGGEIFLGWKIEDIFTAFEEENKIAYIIARLEVYNTAGRTVQTKEESRLFDYLCNSIFSLAAAGEIDVAYALAVQASDPQWLASLSEHSVQSFISSTLIARQSHLSQDVRTHTRLSDAFNPLLEELQPETGRMVVLMEALDKALPGNELLQQTLLGFVQQDEKEGISLDRVAEALDLLLANSYLMDRFKHPYQKASTVFWRFFQELGLTFFMETFGAVCSSDLYLRMREEEKEKSRLEVLREEIRSICGEEFYQYIREARRDKSSQQNILDLLEV